MPRGGKRKGSGRPIEHKDGTKPESFRLPISIARHIETKPNQTEYITELIEDDINKDEK